MTLIRPIPFRGSSEEITANRRTHDFGTEGRCWDCDCRSFGAVATWPCGTDPPRETVGDDATPLTALEALARGRV